MSAYSTSRPIYHILEEYTKFKKNLESISLNYDYIFEIIIKS